MKYKPRQEMTCICCNTKSVQSSSALDDNYDFGGLFIETSGNWGSRIIDVFPGDITLNLFICDKCVLERLDKMIIRKHSWDGISEVDQRYYNSEYTEISAKEHYKNEIDHIDTQIKKDRGRFYKNV